MNFIDGAGPSLPYPGLRPFDPEEFALFFGRTACLREMIERMRASRFLAVIGTSGSGKSSLVRTGLVYALMAGRMADSQPGWKIADFRPGDTPFVRLAEALLAPEEGGAAADPEAAAALAERLRYAPGALTKWCGEGNLPEYTNLLVIVDQFEELFRYQDMSGQEETEAFVARLIESAEARDMPVYIVITMRSDFIGQCALIPRLAEEVNRGLYLVRRMMREEMRQAIVGPTRFFRFEIEPDLVTRLLNDLANFAPWDGETGIDRLQVLARRADQLPLMQHVLNRLWMRVRPGPDGEVLLRDEDYTRLGGLGNALSAHADEVLDSMPQHRAAAETIFRALVEGASIATAVRRPCRFSALADLAGDREAAAAVVEAFRHRDCNFLTPVATVPLDRDPIIDISHESLIRQWKTLADWTMREAASGKQYEDLLEKAREWEASGAEELLPRDDKLRAMTLWWSEAKPTAVWAARYGGGFALTARFLTESARLEAARATAAERARRNREFRNVGLPIFGLALLAVLLIGGQHIYKNYQTQQQMTVMLQQTQRAQQDMDDYNADENKGDVRDAIQKLTDAANLGFADAENELGYDYMNGADGVKTDKQAAVKWVTKAANSGDALAEKNLGLIYSCETPGTCVVKEDDQTAISWFEKAWSHGGFQDAAYRAAMLYVNSTMLKPDGAQALIWFQNAAGIHGDDTADSENQIGTIYAFGEGGIKQDYGKANTWFRKAAQDGSADAAYHLAYRYLHGQGISQDNTQALAWFKVAVKGKADYAAEAEYEIGQLYALGQGGIKQDPVQSASWFQRGAQDGSPDAAYELAYDYLNANGVKQDDAQALTWFQQAVAGKIDNIADAEYQIGYIYEFGEAGARDYGKALTWFRAAAHDGSALAAYRIGLIDLKGVNGAAPDPQSAHLAFAQAAKIGQASLVSNPGDEVSMNNLAWYEILSGQTQQSLALTVQAAKLAPKDLSVEENRADALLMLGQTDAARAIYLNPPYVASKDIGNGETWTANVLDDFATLKETDLTIPPASVALMAEVTQAFSK